MSRDIWMAEFLTLPVLIQAKVLSHGMCNNFSAIKVEWLKDVIFGSLPYTLALWLHLFLLHLHLHTSKKLFVSTIS